jgi:hypothetical protein
MVKSPVNSSLCIFIVWLSAGDDAPLVTNPSASAKAGAAGKTPGPNEDAIRAAPTGFAALCMCLSVDFYRPLFDVDTQEVLQRVRVAFLPFMFPSFFEVIEDKPDLYVPFWGSTTLVFLMGIMGNFASWAAHEATDSIWHYDFSLVTSAAAFMFGFLALSALLAWATLRYQGIPFAFMKLLCMFGYSVLPFSPATILCALPFAWLQWLAVVLAAALSSIFLIRAAVPTFRALLIARYDEGKAARLANYTAAGFVLLMLGFGAAMKFYFFTQMATVET